MIIGDFATGARDPGHASWAARTPRRGKRGKFDQDETVFVDEGYTLTGGGWECAENAPNSHRYMPLCSRGVCKNKSTEDWRGWVVRVLPPRGEKGEEDEHMWVYACGIRIKPD